MTEATVPTQGERSPAETAPPPPEPKAPAADAAPAEQPVAPTAEPPQPEPAAEQAPPPPPPPSYWRPPPKDARTLAAIGFLALAAVMVVLYAWQLGPFAGDAEQTDNAYVRGKTTIISPQVSGYVVDVPAHDFQQVRAGEVLVRIEDRIYRARVGQAQANVLTQLANLANSVQAQRSREASEQAQDAAIGNAQAQLMRAQADMRRVDVLVDDGSVSQREADQTRAALRQAEAQLRQARAGREIARQDVRTVAVGREGLSASVQAAKAQVALAQIDLDHTVIRAPEDGQLSEIGVRDGQYVTSGTQLMFLVPRQLWIIANFKEAQTRGMQPGQRASFRVDALGGARLTGRVENLAPAAGSEFAVLKADNATGNFVKVAQRIAVRIAIDPGQKRAERLRPGMSVVARIDTRSKP